MVKAQYRNHLLRVVGAYVVALSLLLNLHTAEASELISARYLSAGSNRVELAVKVGHPAPTSLIIQQFFPPQSGLRNISPPPAKLQKRQGIAKWFFKNPSPGTLIIRLEFDQRISPGSLSAIIRCRQPRTGQFIEKHIRP